MAKKIGPDRHIAELSFAEKELIRHWEEVSKYIKKDLANVWNDEAKSEFEKIGNEAERVALILKRLNTHYIIEFHSSYKNQEIYAKRIYDMKKLALDLKNIRPNSGWVRMIHNDLQQAIFDIEREKAEVRDINRRRQFLKAATGVLAGGLSGLFSRMFFPSKAEAKEMQTGLQIIPYYSPLNKKREKRRSTKFVILHTTEAKDESSFNAVFNGGLANFLVDTKGNVYETIGRDKIAYHAGKSIWGGTKNLNECSIGIEIAGYHYAPLTEQQYASLRILIKILQNEYKIPDENVLAHYQVAYDVNRYTGGKKARGRKIDGINIDWQKLGIRHRTDDPDVKAGSVKEDPFLSAVRAYEETYGKPPFDSVVSRDGITWVLEGNGWKRYKK